MAKSVNLPKLYLEATIASYLREQRQVCTAARLDIRLKLPRTGEGVFELLVDGFHSCLSIAVN